MVLKNLATLALVGC